MKNTIPSVLMPGQIGSIEIKNRLIRSATWEGLATKEGRCTEALCRLWESLVLGEVGLVITGFCYVHPSGKTTPYMLGIDSDEQIPGLQEICKRIHRLGGKIGMQLSHGGLYARPELIGNETIKAVSVESRQKRRKLQASMSIEEIRELVHSFGQAAGRAKHAGFDLVQLQAGHGYLISQFLSPQTNRRTDRYGGEIQNRARFLLEVYEECKGCVGSDFPIIAKINCSDCLAGGLEVEDSIWVANELRSRGIDALEVSGGVHGAENGPIRKDVGKEKEEGYFSTHARMFKDKLGTVPIVAVGGIRTIERASSLLDANGADFIALSRPFICEPSLAKRWHGGDHTRSKCVSCSRCFMEGLKGAGIRCVGASGANPGLIVVEK
jgi:2,4-dienoyl-CoA reductase-like NADH-dependent reductase (Old Yellow Enzyme family)